MIVPPQGRSTVLAELHGAHPGMTRMKALARQWVWWHLLKPNIGQKVIDKQQQQKNFHDAHCRERIYSEGEKVFVKNNLKGKKWIPGYNRLAHSPLKLHCKMVKPSVAMKTS